MIEIKDAVLRFNDNHSDRDGAPKGIVLHHAAIDADVVSIHNYHRDVNGWAGIGYHFYVTKDGVIWYGRPEPWLGAHTSGFNDRIGICAEGNFEEETMPAVQQNAIVQLIAHLESKYGKLEITRHRDHDATACPGANYPFEAIKVGVLRSGTGDPSPTEGQGHTSSVTADAATPSPQGEGLVRRFQRVVMADGIGLPQYGADGIWGAETAGAASQYVSYGMTGERVRLIQSLVGADADGIFGDKTLDAVKAYQAKRGLAVDGIVGVETWKALLEVTA